MKARVDYMSQFLQKLHQTKVPLPVFLDLYSKWSSLNAAEREEIISQYLKNGVR